MIGQFNSDHSKTQKTAICIGIGIATGDVVAGYTGTQQRASYTCVSETVNLAARLEQHSKQARRGILIDDSTQRSLKHRVRTDAPGTVAFKGKSAAVEVFAVTDGQQT